MTYPARRSLMKAFAATAALGALPLDARAGVARIGHVDLSFYEVTANVVQFLCERQGWNVAIDAGSHSRMFPRVASGDLDLFVAAWLPDAHAVYWERYGSELVQVSTLFEDAMLYWAVPDYMPAADVRGVADLLKPEVAARMVRTIRGTLPDSGLMQGSKRVFEHYGLGTAGYELVSGPAKEWLDNFNARIAARDWFVMPLWRPQYLNKAHRLRILDEPQKLLGGPNRAMLVANKAYFEGLQKKQRIMLSRIEMSLKAVTEMDYWVNVERMSPRDAARRWIGSNPNTVTYWLANPDED
ncbi:MAG: glycine betaine ABC transporter substrate-binding protein [Betaproteobacteria bacterium]